MMIELSGLLTILAVSPLSELCAQTRSNVPVENMQRGDEFDMSV